jgi:hypothetical protein
LTVSLEDDEDDWLHDPSKPDGLQVGPALFSSGLILARRSDRADKTSRPAQHDFFSFRGIANYLTLGLLLGALLMLLCACLPSTF